MTVSTSTSFVSYAGNGSLTTFAYTFKIFQDSDLLVTLVNDASGAETTQVLTTNYTVTGAGSDAGGNVVFSTAPATGVTVKIRRVLPVTQETDYVPNDPFPAEAHEDALDKLTMLVQQEAANSDLAISFPEGDVGSGLNNIVPSAIDRAEKLLKFDTEGNVEVAGANDVFTGTVLGANYTQNTFSGDGSTVVYTLTAAPGSKNNIQIYIDGVYQNKASFSVNGVTLTFTEAPPLNASIECVFGEAIVETSATTTAVDYTIGATGGVERTLQTKLEEFVSVKDFGAVGDGVTDDTAAVNSFLTRIISTGETGYIPDGTYLVNTITLTAANGFRLRGAGTLKATGSNRRNMLTFNGVTGAVDIDEITIDGAGIVARPLDIQNLSATSSTLGYVDLGEDFTVINAKNNTPDTYTAAAVYIEGGFEKVVFAGEIDDVNSTSTSGASSNGLTVTWDAGSSDDWVRQTVITSTARIKNVKNSNTVTADADGCRIFAPTTEKASLVVEAGATFEECKGRAIKSQVQTNTIIGAIIRRSLYDGLEEIALQYSGGTVSGVQCFHDGTRTNYIIVTSQYSSPDNTQTTITDNELVVTGSPASNTNVMIGLNVADGSGVNEGCVISSNRCKGTVNYFISTRNANVTGNRLIVRDNWVETIATAYIQIWRYGSGTPNLNLVFEANGAGAACTGGDLDSTKATIESFKNNYNISAIGGTLSELTIASGAITPTLSYHIVDTQSDAASDDLDTITATYYDIGSELILSAANGARTVVVKDGTGNMELAGDFSMDNAQDTIRLVYNGSNWLEVSRSNNGA